MGELFKKKLWYIHNIYNRLLFPGGGTYFNETGGYGEAANQLYQIALEYNDKGVSKTQ